MNKQITELSEKCACLIMKEIQTTQTPFSDQEIITILIGAITRIILRAKHNMGLEYLKATAKAFSLTVDEIIKLKSES